MAHAVRAPRLSWIVIAAIAGAVSVPPVHAQGIPFAAGGARSWAKSDAILGGQPSALQAILAQQSGLPALALTPRPASYSVPVLPAIVRTEHVVSPGVTSGRPDVFGSVALRIDRAPLMSRWQQVRHARLVGPSARYAQSLSGLDEVERLEAVNRYVNDRVRFVDDRVQYGRADVWTSASDTLSRGKGDCEDYAIAKLQLLRRAGFAEKDLYLVILRDALRRADHAVLVARADGRLLVLDNGTDRLIDSYEMPDYRPIVTFSGNRIWTHGYRRETPPMTYASNEVAKPTVAVAAASVAAVTPGALR